MRIGNNNSINLVISFFIIILVVRLKIVAVIGNPNIIVKIIVIGIIIINEI